MAKKNDKISLSGRFQHKYLKNFVKDDKGEWVYTGDHYRYTNKDIPEKKMHKRLLLLSLAGVTGAAGGGLIKAPGTIDAWYIILPLALTLLFSAVMLYKSISLYFSKSPLRDYDYKSNVETPQVFNLFAMTCGALSMITEIGHVIFFGTEGLVLGMIAFLICEGIVCLSAVYWRKNMNICVYEREEWENEKVS